MLATVHRRCVGCVEQKSAWSRRGDCALHTVIGQNSRRRNGLEPSRRLNETTGPQSPCAFRIALLTAGVTERDAACKPRCRIPHTAHTSGTALPLRSDGRSHVTADAAMPMRADVWAKGGLATRYRARVARRVLVTAPHRRCQPRRWCGARRRRGASLASSR